MKRVWISLVEPRYSHVDYAGDWVKSSAEIIFAKLGCQQSGIVISLACS